VTCLLDWTIEKKFPLLAGTRDISLPPPSTKTDLEDNPATICFT